LAVEKQVVAASVGANADFSSKSSPDDRSLDHQFAREQVVKSSKIVALAALKCQF
jgi:hypothetical protein